jgi:hypothetical protein
VTSEIDTARALGEASAPPEVDGDVIEEAGAAPRHRARPDRRRAVALRDGVRVTLRSIAPSDEALLAASFDRLSPASRYRRFFTTEARLSEADLDYMLDTDDREHEAIVAIDPATGEPVGVVRYICRGEDHELAEVAVTVAAGSLVPARTLIGRVADVIGSTPP